MSSLPDITQQELVRPWWARDIRLRDHPVLLAAVKRVAVWAACASLVWYCAAGTWSVAIRSLSMLDNLWENTHPEGPHVYVALLAAQTHRLYFSYNEPPYVVQSYGPLYYVIDAVVARFSHIDMRSTVLHARELSYFAYLLSAFLIFLICRKAQASSLVSLLAATMFLAQTDLYGWTTTARPDMLCLGAMLVSLYFACVAHESRWGFYAAAGAFAGVSFLIKQPGMAVALAIFVVLAIRREYRNAALLCVSTAVPIIFMFGWLILRKESFWAQFTAVGNGYWSLENAAYWLLKSFVMPSRFVPLTIGLLGFLRAWKGNKTWQMVASFMVVNWIICLTGVIQVGSSTNYFIAGFAGCAMLLPEAIQFLRERALRIPVLVFAAFLLLWASKRGLEAGEYWFFYFKAPSAVSYAAMKPYRILSQFSLVSLYGRDPDFLDTYAVHTMELTGHWREKPVVDEIRQQKYDLAIFQQVGLLRYVSSYRDFTDYSENVVQALNENYFVLCGTPEALVLKPRNREIPLSPDFFGGMFNKPCGTGQANKAPTLKVRPGTL